MFRLLAPIAIAVSVLAQPSWAQDTHAEKTQALLEALGTTELIAIMHEEGRAYGDTLAQEMLPSGPTADWGQTVAAIYDVDVMNEVVATDFAAALQGDDVDAMLAFFASDLGQKIVALEISARRALLDAAIEDASKEAAAIAVMDETPRVAQVTDFIMANDLIEANVVGALNSNYAFYIGLIDGGAMPAGVTPDAALQDVWAQEPQVRKETEEWLYSYFLMAYQPLSDDELDAYLAFSRTPAAQDMTDALFLAFNGMFDDISRALGLASARFMMMQEL